MKLRIAIRAGADISPEIAEHFANALPAALEGFAGSIDHGEIDLSAARGLLQVRAALVLRDGESLVLCDTDPAGRALVHRISARFVDALALRLDPRTARFTHYASGAFRLARDSALPETVRDRRAG
jgi:hypothetical protein